MSKKLTKLGEGVLTGIIVSLGSQLLTFINGGFASIIMAAIVAFQGMILALNASTFGFGLVFKLLLIGAGSIWLPKLIVSVNMFIDGFKGKSYIANIGWFSASYKPA
ncbi:MAG TPA: hypothetical protein PLR16_01960 [Bacilli bacterium]|nr:MAG: hypothetical protein BWY97_00576 [Tenericutes bacterium ADurb.BinA124]HNZ50117.1 hypothetical protein [Bacilli bacterium]HPX84031.1 hypothetical protein [Bacilli bacterium]